MRCSTSVPDGFGSFISGRLIFAACVALLAMNPKDEYRATLVGQF
jgi:hypothetical protein